MTSLIVGETPGGAVGQPMGVEMVFRHIDADGIVLHLFRASACHSALSPGYPFRPKEKTRAIYSSSTRQTVSVLPIRPSPLMRGQPPSLSGPSRLLGAKSHKTSVLHSGLRVSCVPEVCGAFGGRVLSEYFAAGVRDRFVFALPPFAAGS